MDLKAYGKETIAVLAGISKEFGLEHLEMYSSSVNIPKFKLWLQDLRDKYFFADIMVYADNLSVHTSKAVKERMDELSIAYVFSPPYSPDLNPIEAVFSIAKRELKKRRLRAVLHGEYFNTKMEIKRAFESIEMEKIANCISHVEELFRNV